MATEQLLNKGIIADLQNGQLAAAVNQAAHTWAAVPLGSGSNDHSNFTYSQGPKIGLYQPSMPYASFLQAYHNAGGQ